MASKLLQLQSKACEVSRFVSKNGTGYYKQLLEQNKQYIQDPPTVEKCNELSKQLFYTRLARVKIDILGKDSETPGKQVIDVPSVHDEETSFVMFRSHNSEVGGVQMDEEQTKTQEQQLQELVDERIKEVKLIAEKVSRKHA